MGLPFGHSTSVAAILDSGFVVVAKTERSAPHSGSAYAPAVAAATKPAACPAPASAASTDSQTPLLASVSTDGNGGGGVSGSDEELVE